MSIAVPEIVGLFPVLDRTIGGVQSSGRLAYAALNQIDSSTNHLFFDPSEESKAEMAAKALKFGQKAPNILVWHLHLLKVTPLLRGTRRTILFLHGVEAWKRLGWMMNVLVRNTSLVLTNSDFTWNRFVELNPALVAIPRKTVHLGLGTPLVGEVPHTSEAAVVMVGRMDRGENYKGHREIIEAWPIVRRRITNAKLWIIGGGSGLPGLKDLARQVASEEAIVFWGEVSDDKRDSLIAQSRCLALPSRGEGFGLVYLEAMRLGRPCLVSNYDAGREVVSPPEAGLAVDPANREEIADAIVRLITPGGEWNRWSQQARARYENNFTAAHFRKRLVDALCEA